ncbi:MAG: FAD:protein FMN transferase [Synergistaceae bacterium]|jgi:thiamine biosynthesis lipoprotein|nr:FAD:protein FMN transferase [Synergistaceae bacterium]
MNRRLGHIAATLALVALALFAARMGNGDGSAREAKKFSVEFFDTFDTLVSFTAFTKDEIEFEGYARVVHDEMLRLHRLFDIYHDHDGLVGMKAINDAAGGVPLSVDASIADLLEIAKDAYEDTGGAVNVTLGPVLKIWHDHRDRAPANSGDAPIPSLEELQAAATHVSASDILIDREHSTVLLRHADMRLDVGAAAKGYAVQKAVELLRDAGLKSGLINAGGNVVIIGPPLDGRESWNIGVRAPDLEELRPAESKLLDVLYLSDGAAVTSGSDQRYFTSGGRRYHHIIDPETLFPAENVRSVTVRHPNSTVADILSTAAFVLPPDRARALIARHGAEALWVTGDGKKLATPGYLARSQLVRSADAAKGGAAEP